MALIRMKNSSGAAQVGAVRREHGNDVGLGVVLGVHTQNRIVETSKTGSISFLWKKLFSEDYNGP